MELLLNVLWLIVALTAFAVLPRRSVRASIILACVLALLFPIISVSDDLSADRVALEEALAVIVAVLILVVGLIAIARMETRVLRPALILIATPSDPRSPPRS